MKISDERLAEFRLFAKFGRETGSELVEVSRAELDFVADEIEQSRARVAELRALAERMRGFVPACSFLQSGMYEEGQSKATQLWLRELSSLLAAHGAAHGAAQTDAEKS